MSVFIIHLIVFIWHSSTGSYPLPLFENNAPAISFRALHDVLLQHYPAESKDLVFYQQANEPQFDLGHLDIINTVIQQLNGMRSTRVEQSSNVTDTNKQAKRLLNVIVVDGVESFR